MNLVAGADPRHPERGYALRRTLVTVCASACAFTKRLRIEGAPKALI